MEHSEDALIIFIKNPQRGKVKTRLARTSGDARALQIYNALLQHTRKLALEIDVTRYLFYSDFVNTQDAWSASEFKKRLQKGKDLGIRMANAFKEVLSKYQKAVIIGSDCASLSPAIVREAFIRLDEVDYVLGPAMDGGYYLLGMQEYTPELFTNIPWSTEDVAALTLKKIGELDATFGLLPQLSDIDYEEDWEQFGWDLE